MSLMRQEVLQAPLAVQRLLATAPLAELGSFLRRLAPRYVASCARGSSAHAAHFLQVPLGRLHGLALAPAAPSLASLYGAAHRREGALLLAVSQSGASPDLLAETMAVRAGGGFALGLLNASESPLAQACDAVLDIAAGPERSVAATKSVLCSMVAGLALLAHWAQDAALLAALERLPSRLASAAARDWSALAEMLLEDSPVLVIGRGPGEAVAREAALKLAECCALPALAFGAAEFRHGPAVLAAPGRRVLGFVQADATGAATIALLEELAASGARVLAAGATVRGAIALPTLPQEQPEADLLAHLLSFYLAAEAASLARGRDPDHPPGLAKATRTR